MAESEQASGEQRPKPVFLREIEVKFKKKRVKDGSPVGEKVDGPEQIYSLFKDLENEMKEKLICISLDAKLKIICFEVVAIGSINSVYARPIEVIRTAIPWNPYSFIIIHNHPSGDPSPSETDKQFTEQLQAAVKTLGCSLCDHIIIGDGKYFSFADEGLIE